MIDSEGSGPLLEVIRRQEAEIKRRLAAQREAGEAVLAEAEHRAREMLIAAEAEGRRVGEAQRQAAQAAGQVTRSRYAKPVPSSGARQRVCPRSTLISHRAGSAPADCRTRSGSRFAASCYGVPGQPPGALGPEYGYPRPLKASTTSMMSANPILKYTPSAGRSLPRSHHGRGGAADEF